MPSKPQGMFGHDRNVNVHLGEVHIHVHTDGIVGNGLQELKALLNQLLNKEIVMAATLDDVQAAVAAETEVVNSAKVLLENLAQMLRDALASGDPAKVQEVLDKIEANKQTLADAVAANTP